jgi:hypothetical protein
MTEPSYYQFGDVGVLDVSEHLTGNAAQVVQYVARSSRLDGKTKGEDLTDLYKARDFLNREILRLEKIDHETHLQEIDDQERLAADAIRRIQDQPVYDYRRVEF